jgi:hypothetical protein
VVEVCGRVDKEKVYIYIYVKFLLVCTSSRQKRWWKFVEESTKEKVTEIDKESSSFEVEKFQAMKYLCYWISKYTNDGQASQRSKGKM